MILGLNNGGAFDLAARMIDLNIFVFECQMSFLKCHFEQLVRS